MTAVDEVTQRWATRLYQEFPEESEEVRQSILTWLLGPNPERFNEADPAKQKDLAKALEYRYQILQQRYWQVSPDRAYENLIKRLSSLFLVRSKVRTWISLSRDRRRTVTDVLQEVIQEMLQSDRYLKEQTVWIAECSPRSQVRNLLMLATVEEYCLRPIRNQPLLVYRFVNYLRRSQSGGMTNIPSGEMISLISEDFLLDETISEDELESVSLLDKQAFLEYKTRQEESDQSFLYDQIFQEFSKYLRENVSFEAAEWLGLYLQGFTQGQIAESLDLPVKQIYRLREKVSYFASRFIKRSESESIKKLLLNDFIDSRRYLASAKELFDSQDYATAINAYREALEVYEIEDAPLKWAEAQRGLAESYLRSPRGLRSNNLESAIQHYQQSLEIYTHEAFSREWAATQFGLAESYLQRFQGGRSENIEKAISACHSALQVYTRESFPEGWAKTHVLLGKARSSKVTGDRSENLNRAILSYQQALEINTDLLEAWTGKGDALTELKRYDEAISSYDWALALAPDSAAVLNSKGVVLAELERYEEAVASYDSTLAVKPDFARAWDNRGNSLIRLGRYEEAISSYEQALQLEPNVAETWNHKGKALKNLERFDEALSNFSRAIELKPHFVSAIANRGETYRLIGRYEEAIADFNRALEVDPNDELLKVSIESKLARALLQSDNSRGAIEVALAISDQEERLRVLTYLVEEVKKFDGVTAEELLYLLQEDADERVIQLVENIQLAKLQEPSNYEMEVLTRIELVECDLLDLEADALVNPTGLRVRSVGSVGTSLLRQLDYDTIRALNDLPPLRSGEVFTTGAGKLSAHYLIHTPIKNNDGWPTTGSVVRGVKAALAKAEELGDVRTIAFPSMGTGAAGLDPKDIAPNVIKALIKHLKRGSQLERITFAFIDNIAYRTYFHAHQRLLLDKLTYSLALTISPQTIQVGGELEVSIQLKPVNNNEADYIFQTHKIDSGSDLNIFLTAPGCQFSGTSNASLPFPFENNQVTQTTRFILTALRPGFTTISAELFCGDAFETTLERTIEVVGLEEAAFLDSKIQAEPRPVHQPDLFLRIQTLWNETASACTFRYHLKSFRASSLLSSSITYQSQALAITWLEQAHSLMGDALKTISEAFPADEYSHFTSLGQYLYQQLFPPELQIDLRNLNRYSVQTLLIQADQDAQFPWSLLHDGQEYLGERFTIGHWFWDLNAAHPYEFPVGAINIAHYANVEQPETWATLLEPPGAPSPYILTGGILDDLNSIEAMRGLHLLRLGQSEAEANRQDAPVPLNEAAEKPSIDEKVRPIKLNLRRNRPLVSLGYLRNSEPELTDLHQTWASTFLRAGCSAFVGPLWTVNATTEAAFISSFYHALWTGDSLGGAFHKARRMARAANSESVDWLAYCLFGDPMARPYRPVPGQGYAVVEPVGQDIADPIVPGSTVRFRVSLRRTPPVWHDERVIEVAEDLSFNDLQAHIAVSGLQVTPATSIELRPTPSGNYLGWFNVTVPADVSAESALVQVYFADGMQTIHTLSFPLTFQAAGGDA